MTKKDWRFPLNLAIGLHLAIGISAVYLPDLLDRKPPFEEIYTVNLINVAEFTPPPPAAPPQEPAAPEPEVVKENAVSLAKPPAVTPAPSAKTISIKPKKRKIKKVVKQVDPLIREREVAKIQRQKILDMIQAENEATEQAKLLQQEAERVRQLMELERQRRNQTTPETTTRPVAPTPSSGKQATSIEKQYQASVYGVLYNHWNIPEHLKRDETLVATVIIKVLSDGVIIDNYFEERSGDVVFDTFVKKTILEVGKLPPFPPALKKKQLEFLINFRPTGIR